MASTTLRLSNRARETYINNVIEAMPKETKELEDALTDLYWKFILRSVEPDAPTFRRYKAVYDNLLRIRASPSTATRMYGYQYGYYTFTSDVERARLNNRRGRSMEGDILYYGPGVDYDGRIINVSVEEMAQLEKAAKERRIETERVMEFSEVLRKKVYSVTTVSRLKEILPDFARHLPT